MVPEGSLSRPNQQPLFPPDTTEVVLYAGGLANRSVRLVTVQKVTATQVVLPAQYEHQAPQRFDAFTGYERCQRGYHADHIVPATPEAREAARRSTATDQLGSLAFQIESFLKSEKFKKRNRSADELELSLASLKAAYEVLTA